MTQNKVWTPKKVENAWIFIPKSPVLKNGTHEAETTDSGRSFRLSSACHCPPPPFPWSPSFQCYRCASQIVIEMEEFLIYDAPDDGPLNVVIGVQLYCCIDPPDDQHTHLFLSAVALPFAHGRQQSIAL